jgi:predicted metal-dependent peptidase
VLSGKRDPATSSAESGKRRRKKKDGEEGEEEEEEEVGDKEGDGVGEKKMEELELKEGREVRREHGYDQITTGRGVVCFSTFGSAAKKRYRAMLLIFVHALNISS